MTSTTIILCLLQQQQPHCQHQRRWKVLTLKRPGGGNNDGVWHLLSNKTNNCCNKRHRIITGRADGCGVAGNIECICTSNASVTGGATAATAAATAAGATGAAVATGAAAAARAAAAAVCPVPSNDYFRVTRIYPSALGWLKESARIGSCCNNYKYSNTTDIIY